MSDDRSDARARVIQRYKIAFDTGLSYSKCRKILISAGHYSSPRANQIRALFESGMNKESIAATLHIKPKSLEGYCPYTKGVYLSETPTENAMRIRRYRSRNKGEGNEKA